MRESADGVRVTADVPTGLAMISVDHAGENIITVAPGANHEVGPAEVARPPHRPQNVLVICAEIPVARDRAALARHRRQRPQPGAGPGAPG